MKSIWESPIPSAKLFGDDGAIDEGGLIIGTYIDGLFENKKYKRCTSEFSYK